MKKKSVLITGSSGFLGKNLISLLKKYDYEIYGTTRTQKKAHTIKTTYFDLEKINSFDDSIKNKSIVIHCAGIAHRNGINESKYYNLNYISTVNLYKKCDKNNVKIFIFISSINVCINNNSDVSNPINENEISDNFDKYTKYKILAEKKLIELSKIYNCVLIILRPGLIYGPGVKGNLKSLIQLLNKNFPLPFGNCHNQRDMISVFNIALIIHKLIEKKNLSNQIFNISDGERIKFLTFLKIIKIKLGKKRFFFFNVNKTFLKLFFGIFYKKNYYNKLYDNLLINNDRIIKEINWKSHFSIEYGIEKTCESFIKQKDD